MNRKLRVSGIIVIVVVAVVLGVKFKMSQAPVGIDPELARSKGNIQAQVHVVEFIDFQCPACAYGAKVLKEYLEKYPERIYVQVRYFPLTNMHRHAITSALYSECAARQGKFWALHELMMPQQAQWDQLLSADPVFRVMAQQAGVNMAKLDACLVSEETLKVINDEKSIGQSMGVKSTPTYFINKKMVVGGKSLTEELNKYFPSMTALEK